MSSILSRFLSQELSISSHCVLFVLYNYCWDFHVGFSCQIFFVELYSISASQRFQTGSSSTTDFPLRRYDQSVRNTGMEINLGDIPFDLDFHPSDQLVAAGVIGGNLHLYFLFHVFFFIWIHFDFPQSFIKFYVRLCRYRYDANALPQRYNNQLVFFPHMHFAQICLNSCNLQYK